MRGLPPELVYLLLFIGVLLFQYMTRRRAGQGAPEPAQDADDGQARDDVFDPDELERQATSMTWSPSRTPVEPPRRVGAATPAPRARAPRRFSRQALMGTRRDVQNAVVIATILGPCRALEPPGGDAGVPSPRRTER